MTIRTVTGNIIDITGSDIPEATFSLIPESFVFGSDPSAVVFGDIKTIVADGNGDVNFDLHEGKYLGRISTSQGSKTFRLVVDSDGPWTLGRLIGELQGITPSIAAQIFEALEAAETAAQDAAESAALADSEGNATAAQEAAQQAQGHASDASQDAAQTALDVIAAEAARDAAFVNADVYADTAAGLAATSDGDQFQVVEGDEIIRYRNDVGTAEEVARYPSASVFALTAAASKAPLADGFSRIDQQWLERSRTAPVGAVLSLPSDMPDPEGWYRFTQGVDRKEITNFDPTAIVDQSRVLAWFDTRDSVMVEGGGVSSLRDKSSAAKHLSQFREGARPTLNGSVLRYGDTSSPTAHKYLEHRFPVDEFLLTDFSEHLTLNNMTLTEGNRFTFGTEDRLASTTFGTREYVTGRLYRQEMYVEPDGIRFVGLAFPNGEFDNENRGASFDLQEGVVASVGTHCHASIVPHGSGFICTLQTICVSSGSSNSLGLRAGVEAGDNGLVPSMVGDGTSSMVIHWWSSMENDAPAYTPPFFSTMVLANLAEPRADGQLNGVALDGGGGGGRNERPEPLRQGRGTLFIGDANNLRVTGRTAQGNVITNQILGSARQVVSVLWDEENTKVWVGQTEVASDSIEINNLKGLLLGHRMTGHGVSGPWLGDIGELLLIDGEPTEEERTALINYMLRKYEVTSAPATPGGSGGSGGLSESVFPDWRATASPAQVEFEQTRYTREGRGQYAREYFTASQFDNLFQAPNEEGSIGAVMDAYGWVTMIPFDDTTLVRINPETLEFETDAGLTGGRKWVGGVLGRNNTVYGVPYTAQDVLVKHTPLDGVPAAATRETFGLTLTGDNKWYGGVLAPNGNIYCVPHDATDILIIDTTTTPATASRSNMGSSLSGESKWAGGILAPNGKIYCAPRSAQDVLVIDPDAGTATRTDFGLSLGTETKYVGIVLGADGKLWCIPRTAKEFLVIDYETETAVLTNLGSALPAGVNLWYGGIAAPDGLIYCIPRESDKFLVIDPVGLSWKLETFGRLWDDSFRIFGNGVLDTRGDIWCAPRGTGRVLRLRRQGGAVFDRNYSLSTRSNKF